MINELITPEVAKRFYAKVAQKDENGCMLWTASKDLDGYGRIKVLHRTRKATQVAYFLATRVWINTANGECMLHTCDTPACVNSEHLRIGTNAENTVDMIAKGRQADRRGVKHGKTVKVTEEQVRQMRSSYQDGFTQAAIARDVGISRQQVGRIISGKRWGHIV